MRIVVINLARAADRRRKMEMQFATFGLAFEILEATDGRHITDEERGFVDHGRRRCITPYPLTDNEIGCWLSHRRAMQDLIATGEGMMTIVEDDALLFPDFPHVLKAIETQTESFDLIDLHRTFKRKEVFMPCRSLIPGYALGRIGYMHMNATAYVISLAGARKFLSYARRFVHAIDKEIHRYWANGLDLYGLEQPVALHADEGRSFIDETRSHDRPQERASYPDSDTFYWRSRRWVSSAIDSVWKRAAFHISTARDKRKRTA